MKTLFQKLRAQVGILKINKLALACIILLAACSSWAAVSGEDEYTVSDLNQQTVLPRTDYPETVLNKNIKFQSNFDVTFERAHFTDELFWRSGMYGIRVGYYWNEDFAFGANYQTWDTGQNEYADSFSSSSGQLNFSRPPHPTSNIFVYVNHNYFYGKMSFSHDLVLNHIFFGRYTVGMTNYDTGSLPHLNYSLGFKSFFNKHLFVELDYGLSFHQVYNPVSKDIRESAPVVAKDNFDKKFQISQLMTLAIGYLF